MRSLALLFAGLLALAVLPAAATSNHDYGPDEWAPIADATSPDGRLRVVAHGEGELGIDGFGLHLARVDGTRVGPLTGPDDPFLDTAPDAYRAFWAPDSRHVAVTFRADRHEVETSIWTVGDGRIARVAGPDLVETAVKKPRDDALEEKRVAGRRAIVWTAPDRFTLTDTRVFRVKAAKLPAFGRFGRTLDDIGDGQVLHAFSATAECRLTGPNRFRVEKIVPGDFER